MSSAMVPRRIQRAMSPPRVAVWKRNAGTEGRPHAGARREFGCPGGQFPSARNAFLAVKAARTMPWLHGFEVFDRPARGVSPFLRTRETPPPGGLRGRRRFFSFARSLWAGGDSGCSPGRSLRRMSAVLGLGEARRTLRWVAADSESGAYDYPSCGQIATECTILGHYEPARSRKAASPEGQDSRRQRRGGSASGVLRPVPVYDAPYEGETPPLPRAWCLGDSPPGRNARRPQPDWHASW